MTFPDNFDPNSDLMNDGIFGITVSPEFARLILIPVPWQATSSYRLGTMFAPEAILKASKQVELFDLDFAQFYEQGIVKVDVNEKLQSLHHSALNVRKTENKTQLDNLSSRMAHIVEQEARYWREQGKLVGVIGGEHTICVGAIKAIASEYKMVSVLQIDAHSDLRKLFQGMRWSHACTASRILDSTSNISSLVQVGVRDICPGDFERLSSDEKIVTFFDKSMAGSGNRVWSVEAVISSLAEHVWISFDIDGLDPSLCPQTGTPVPGGLSWEDTMLLIRALVKSGKTIIGFDLCEVSPGRFDQKCEDSWDAIVGARVLYKLCGLLLRSSEEDLV